MRILGLKRRTESPLESIISALTHEIEHGGHYVGIDMMIRYLFSQYGIIAKRETVRDVLEILLPGALAERRRRRLARRTYSSAGPNFLLHVDQYDKLAPYGFYIHGAIDGFSRQIMWLTVGNTNRDSSTVLHFYLKTALAIGGIPKLLRVDGGTENSLMLKVHALFRESAEDRFSHSSYYIGRSVHNQRIEQWWGFLRTHFTQFWMEIFTDMTNLHIYDPSSEVHRQLLQFCFTLVLRNDLCDIVNYWNNHKVRKVSQSKCPSGIPELLYSVPEVYGKTDQRHVVDLDLLQFADEQLGKPLNEYGCTNDFAEICLEMMIQVSIGMPNNAVESIELFACLLSEMETIMDN